MISVALTPPRKLRCRSDRAGGPLRRAQLLACCLATGTHSVYISTRSLLHTSAYSQQPSIPPPQVRILWDHVSLRVFIRLDCLSFVESFELTWGKCQPQLQRLHDAYTKDMTEALSETSETNAAFITSEHKQVTTVHSQN